MFKTDISYLLYQKYMCVYIAYQTTKWAKELREQYTSNSLILKRLIFLAITLQCNVFIQTVTESQFFGTMSGMNILLTLFN